MASCLTLNAHLSYGAYHWDMTLKIDVKKG
jgi:hypothetical protein